jgi:NAD(P)-dependent dehydrogenase (short-subunit alcohol dehydrogenase family)
VGPRDHTALEGATVVITGGARGIGRATAAAFAERGSRVVIGDLDVEMAERTADEIGGGTRAFELDVTSRDSFETMLDAVETLGSLRVLVNNAGLMGVEHFAEETDEDTARQVAVNLVGVLNGSKLAIPRMSAAGGGRIVNIASVAGKAGFAGAATYCATKHAVVGFSEALRSELRSTPVGVSVVMPSLVDTELTSGLPQPRGMRKQTPEAVAAAIVKSVRRGRFDVYVPRGIGVGFRVRAALPGPVRRGVESMLGGEDLLFQHDHEERAEYVRRTTRA